MKTVYCILILAGLAGCTQQHKDPVVEDKFAPYDHQFNRLFSDEEDIDVKSALRELTESVAVHDRKNRSADGSWVVEGPSNIGARINAVAVNPKDSSHMLAGFSSGGLYQTRNGGRSWNAVFESNEYLAIGDVAFSPHDDQVVLLGTGDSNISGYPFLGNGVFRSNDGGDTWQSLGLQDEGIVSKVGFHPSDPEVIFASSMGLPYQRGEQRGLYRSDDNGDSWTQILYLGDQTGVIDFLVDPLNGNELYAAGWDRIRRYDESTISGLGAKIYRTDDGGLTWAALSGGLPTGIQGRIGLARAPSNPSRIYALYVNTDSNLEGIYTSVNAGLQWQEVPTNPLTGLSSSALGGFGWYFGKIRIHPTDEMKPYILGVSLWEFLPDSQDWKLTIQSPGVHADMHDLVFVGRDTMVLATDGGLYRSPNQGRNWTDIESIATTQFYRVDYNPHTMGQTWGGAQDNGITRGNADGIDNWIRVRGADGFRSIFHPDDPLIFYTESQRGGLAVTTDGGITFGGATTGIINGDRRNWDLPVIMSHHNPDVLYYGTQRLYRSNSGPAVLFEAISPDLADSDFPFAPTSNITSIAESRTDASALLVGTGDGNLWSSTNGGATWQNIGRSLPERWFTSVQFGDDSKQYFVTQTGYKDGVFIPFIHRTDDGGQSWKNIGQGLPQTSVNDLLILANNDQQVLFSATDAGVYYTVDAGDTWARLGDNLPMIATYELDYDLDRNVLLAATFGKSIQSFDLGQLGLDAGSTVSTRAWQQNLTIYPNPVDQLITVKGFPDVLSQYVWTIVDLNGQTINLPFDDRFASVADLPGGIYYLHLGAKGKTWQGKFIKM